MRFSPFTQRAGPVSYTTTFGYDSHAEAQLQLEHAAYIARNEDHGTLPDEQLTREYKAYIESLLTPKLAVELSRLVTFNAYLEMVGGYETTAPWPHTKARPKPIRSRLAELASGELTLEEARTDFEIRYLVEKEPKRDVFPENSLAKQLARCQAQVPVFDPYGDKVELKKDFEDFITDMDNPLYPRIVALQERIRLCDFQYPKFDLVEKGIAMCHELKFKIRGQQDWNALAVVEDQLKNLIPEDKTKDDYDPAGPFSELMKLPIPDFIKQGHYDWQSDVGCHTDRAFMTSFGIETSQKALKPLMDAQKAGVTSNQHAPVRPTQQVTSLKPSEIMNIKQETDMEEPSGQPIPSVEVDVDDFDMVEITAEANTPRDRSSSHISRKRSSDAVQETPRKRSRSSSSGLEEISAEAFTPRDRTSTQRRTSDIEEISSEAFTPRDRASTQQPTSDGEEISSEAFTQRDRSSSHQLPSDAEVASSQPAEAEQTEELVKQYWDFTDYESEDDDGLEHEDDDSDILQPIERTAEEIEAMGFEPHELSAIEEEYGDDSDEEDEGDDEDEEEDEQEHENY